MVVEYKKGISLLQRQRSHKCLSELYVIFTRKKLIFKKRYETVCIRQFTAPSFSRYWNPARIKTNQATGEEPLLEEYILMTDAAHRRTAHQISMDSSSTPGQSPLEKEETWKNNTSQPYHNKIFNSVCWSRATIISIWQPATNPILKQTCQIVDRQ